MTASPSWLDLYSPDPAEAAEFYRALFGWTYQSAGPEEDWYGFFQLQGKKVAGLGQLNEGDGNPAWTVYFQTSDADTAAEVVEENGGTVRFEAFDVAKAGRAYWLADPTTEQGPARTCSPPPTASDSSQRPSAPSSPRTQSSRTAGFRTSRWVTST
ncbi:VOC family protein [Streptomyces sp. P1-3]|uniref:VOC family protein n=1 Tax=Streptomyces sp. P1-3 TaxID=3421658 RepID=UPI003D35F67A